ncbi:hypothetical protein MCOL2_13809 [Listeria fleischmannii FSL S10-1203]|uniref:Uncharacterized protein n=2 Tax=Listeria fleischmannii TaxID=1069827 RepID=W7DWJ0_9LIST|nr:hypothetical protein MCOL2_13809 [Listeria fleischmannii FSL S10-1203]
MDEKQNWAKEQHQLLCFLHEVAHQSKTLTSVDMIALLRVNSQVSGQLQEAYAALTPDEVDEAIYIFLKERIQWRSKAENLKSCMI